MVTDKLTWDQAGSRCQSLNSRAHLVVFNNAEEESDVVESIGKHFGLPVCGSLGFWAAGQRINPGTANSTFVWKIVNDGSCPKLMEMTYTHWAPSQPDHNATGSESCLNMWTDKNYLWNDLNCLDHLCSMCEIDL
jgi:hypothetical protein